MVKHLLLSVVAFSLFAPVTAALTQQAGTPRIEKPVSVFVLDPLASGFRFTSVKEGVDFDIEGNGRLRRVGWTPANSDDGFLFLDVNGNGRVDDGRELLGNGWRRPDGSRVVSADQTLQIIQGVTDLPLGLVPPELAHVAYIDANDDVYAEIQFWRDTNHNGRSEASELQTLSKAGITKIFVGFRIRRTKDGAGNVQLIEGIFYFLRGREESRRPMSLVEFAR